jgi:hypothetical protein
VYLLFLLTSLILVFPNTFCYILCLLVFVLISLFYLTSISYVNTILFLMVVVVYLGAIIIFIGYICAIRPNVVLSHSNSPITLFLFFSLLSLFLTLPKSDLSIGSCLTNSFYSPFGFFVFILLLFFLFISLLIVTSYYLSSKGPLRSTSA